MASGTRGFGAAPRSVNRWSRNPAATSGQSTLGDSLEGVIAIRACHRQSWLFLTRGSPSTHRCEVGASPPGGRMHTSSVVLQEKALSPSVPCSAA